MFMFMLPTQIDRNSTVYSAVSFAPGVAGGTSPSHHRGGDFVDVSAGQF
jgi:hypothetical protein